MFYGCTVLPDSEETERGSSNQGEGSAKGSLSSADKNTWVVLHVCTLKCVPRAISGVWLFLRSLGVICYDR